VAGFDETGARATGRPTPVSQELRADPPGRRRAESGLGAANRPKRRGCHKQSKARKLLNRFRAPPDSILAFLRDFAVPFDNNQSERDLRMMKLRWKISGTFHSFQALMNFCRIHG